MYPNDPNSVDPQGQPQPTPPSLPQALLSDAPPTVQNQLAPTPAPIPNVVPPQQPNQQPYPPQPGRPQQSYPQPGQAPYYQQQYTEPGYSPDGSLPNGPQAPLPPDPVAQSQSVDQQIAQQMPSYQQQQQAQQPLDASPMPFIEPTLPNPDYASASSGAGPNRRLILVIAVAIIVLLPALLWLIPPVRLAIANGLGFGQTLQVATVTMLKDGGEELVLKNTTIAVNGTTTKTNDKGQATLQDVPYGTVDIVAQKDGYKSVTYQASLGFGIFGGGKSSAVKITMATTGEAVSFKAVDWLTNKPVTSGEFTINDIVVKPNSLGVVEGNAPSGAKEVKVIAKFDGTFTSKTFTINPDSSTSTVTFVPAGKHYYVGQSKESNGIISVYRSNLDGTGLEEVVKGTPNDTPATEFMPSPNERYGILASLRDGAKSTDQQPLWRIYIVDLQTKKLTKIDEGVDFRFSDWTGTIFGYIIYDKQNGVATQTLKHVDASNARVYNFETASKIQTLTGAHDKVVYLVENSQLPESTKSPEMKIASLQGSNIKTIGEKVDMATFQQLGYGRLVFKSNEDLAWHEFNMQNDQSRTVVQPDISLNKLTRYTSGPSPDQTHRLFAIGSNFTYSLNAEDITSNTKRQILPPSVITRYIRWANSSVVIASLVSPTGTADYAIPLDGSGAKKIRDW